MARERDRRERSRSRSESKAPLLSTGAFGRELGLLRLRLDALPILYAAALDEGSWPPGGSGIGPVTGGSPSDATVAAFSATEQTDRRNDARRAVEWLRQATQAVRNAERCLRGEQVPQPTTVDARATITQEELDRRRKRVSPEHLRREEELRR